MRRVAASALAFVLMALATAAGGSTTTISVQDSFFQPAYRVVLAGDRVVWRVDGSAAHTVTTFPDAPESFDSSPQWDRGTGPCRSTVLNPDDCLRHGDTYGHIFGTPGTYRYYCKVHGRTSVAPDASKPGQSQPCGMCGIIVVRAATSPTPTQLATPSRRPSASPSASASRSTGPAATSDASALPTAIGSPAASGSSSASRLALALIIIVVLSGAAYLTWRRFIAPGA